MRIKGPVAGPHCEGDRRKSGQSVGPVLRSAEPHGLSLDDFRAYMPSHLYIFIPTGELWPASSVNARLGTVEELDAKGRPVLDQKGKPKRIRANTWLDRERAVEQMIWAPGEPVIVEGRLCSEGGWIHRAECSCFNLYKSPTLSSGDPLGAGPWIGHVQRIYPLEAPHLIYWLAHRIQRPHEKINHALVLGGAQGIGKDTMLEPIKAGVGPWNFIEVTPRHLLGRFNGFVKSVILRISEARDLGDMDRFAFYDHMKTYTAAPPDVLRVDEKHLREYAVFNVCGVIITSNHKTDGIFLPAEDRRHYVAWSDASRHDFPEEYWKNMYRWYAEGGTANVIAYLRQLDLAGFDAKAPPPKTDAFWSIVDANRSSEDAEVADALERLGNPPAITIDCIISAAGDSLRAWLNERKNRRAIPHRLEERGYEPIRNPNANDGLWKFPRGRKTIYARRELCVRDRIGAAEHLVRSPAG